MSERFRRVIRALTRDPLPALPLTVQSKAPVVDTPMGARVIDRVEVSNALTLRWPRGAFTSPPLVQIVSHKPSAAFSVAGVSAEECTIFCREIGEDGLSPGHGEVTVIAQAL